MKTKKFVDKLYDMLTYMVDHDKMFIITDIIDKDDGRELYGDYCKFEDVTKFKINNKDKVYNLLLSLMLNDCSILSDKMNTDEFMSRCNQVLLEQFDYTTFNINGLIINSKVITRL